MLTGGEALARALGAARVRRAWSFPGAPLTRIELALDKGGAIAHRFAVNEQVAVSMALGGALLQGNGTCVLLQNVGINVALDALATFGLVNELRSAALVIEGVDPEPRSAQNAQDNRAPLAHVAHILQLEPSAPDEIYHYTRLAAVASARAGLPIALRVGARMLDAKAQVQEPPPDLPGGGPTFARAAGPYVCTTTSYRFHVDKRARRLAALEPFVDALAMQSGVDGGQAVVLAGGLGAEMQARAWARRLPALRLAACWPLPRQRLLDFLRGRAEVLVLEEGEPFLEREIQAFVHREGLTCQVSGIGGARPTRLGPDRIEAALGRFGGRIRAESEPEIRSVADWRSLYEAAGGVGPDDGEPWPFWFARTRGALPGFADEDPRRNLLKALRGLERPTVIVGDPGNTGTLGIRDRLVDVGMHMGSAAPVAGALAEAADVEEQAGAGAPLAVALIGDTNYYHSELNGILDNAIARREVLHVLVVNRRSEMTAGARTPYLSDEALESQLRAAGLHVATAMLDDPGLGAAVAYAASRTGPRALICYVPAHARAGAEPSYGSDG